MSVTHIPLADCLLQLGIGEAFILTLEERGLTHPVREEQSLFIDEYELIRLEKMVRMYTELEINIEGIETIMHLLDRVEQMQQEIQSLRNRLRLYE